MKKFLIPAMTMLLLFSSVAVYADTTETKAGTCEFTGKKMVSSFDSTQLAVSVSEMEPGDSVTFSVDIINSSSYNTSWYMSNDVLQSLEDAQAVADNGGYTYILSYTDSKGETTDIYNSSSVGGDKDGTDVVGEGLNEATDNLDSFFYLTSLASGQSGRVDLYVELDGESQGNIYQDTLAQLMMNFAVETSDSTYKTPPSVKTGDVFQYGAFALLGAGLILFIIAFIKLRKDKEKEKKAKSAAKSAGTLALALVLALGTLIGTTSVKAAEDYTYSITISAGNRGTFTNLSAIQIQTSNRSNISVKKTAANKITISGLEYGDVFSCNAQKAVSLGDDSKYYIQGIRLAGRDNNTVAKSTFTVVEDQDYVIAYGIPGDLTQYTINYLDEDGNTLAESQTYYGNVGDEPVIAYLYIDGYVPQVYNLSQPLVADATKNVFDFIYTASATGGQEEEGGDNGGNNGGNNNNDNNADNEENNADNNDEETDGPVIIDNGTTPLADGDDSATVDPGTNESEQTITENEVPKSSNFLNMTIESMKEKGILIPSITALAAGIVLILGIIFIIAKKKQEKKAAKEDSEE